MTAMSPLTLPDMLAALHARIKGHGGVADDEADDDAEDRLPQYAFLTGRDADAVSMERAEREVSRG